jgi:hypothetical protein
MTTNHDHVQATIDEVDARRHNGNKLVNPPCRHLGNGVFENAVLDGHGGYYYPSDVLVKAPDTFTVPGF